MPDAPPQRRDPRLIPLSHDHHHALARAREVVLALEGKALDGTPGTIGLDALAARLAAFCGGELAAHFAREEDHLLPAYRAAGGAPLAAETERQHAHLRGLAAALETGGAGPLAARLLAWSRAITGHVRFEERELFPAVQAALDERALTELGKVLADGAGPACNP